MSGEVRQFGAMEYSTPPTDLDVVRQYRLDRVRQQLAKHDYAGALLFDPLNVRYATDSTNMQVWCTHYEVRCALVMTSGPVILLEFGDMPHLSDGLPTVDQVIPIQSFCFFATGHGSERRVQDFATQVNDVFTLHCSGNRRLAIDRLSHQVVDAIRAQEIQVVDAVPVMEVARSIKSSGEIELMKSSVDVAQQGMAAMQAALQPGITENALWSILHQTNIQLGGEWIETRLLSSGERTNPWFRESSMRQIERGDIVCLDTDMIGPYGYCADISRSWVCDADGSDEQKRLYSMAYEQIHHNIDLLAPGLAFRDFSRRAWSIPAELQKNSYECMIHGVGLADEWPTVPPWHAFEHSGYDGELEAGMVICVESYVGPDGGSQGVKLEEMVLLTDHGTERISNYPYEMHLLQ